jgi:sugar transferase (PEP-CTERM/EpsH1 system associated)
LSQDLEGYLVDAVGVPPARIARICNGVDTDAFRPAEAKSAAAGSPFSDRGLFVFGTVGRLQRVKNQALLARAFVRLLELAPEERRRLRLVIVGEGPMRSEIAEILARADALTLAWLPGSRNDVAEILRSLDVFVLPSLAEGISNTILEAMASGVPVIATRVGGNAELVDDDQTGTLVASGDPQALAEAMLRYVRNPDLLREQGRASRIRAEQLHSLDAMVAQYVSLYDRLLCDVRASAGTARAGDAPHVTTGGD